MGYNFEPVDHTNEYELLKPGKYNVIIDKTEKKQAKNPENYYLNLSLRIVEGRSKNRLIFDMVNIWNSNKVAAEIAQRTMEQIAFAIKKPITEDNMFSDIKNVPITVSVGIDDPQNGYDKRNKVIKYLPLEQEMPDSIRNFEDDVPGETPLSKANEQEIWS